MSVVTLQDEIVHFEVMGRSRPVIFVHGWVGSWRYWVPSMQATSIGYRAFALDMWGFGDTAKLAQNYPLEQQVKLLSDFMDALGMSKSALIGHGLGAVVALMFASRYPEQVGRVMLNNMPMMDAGLSLRLRTSNVNELAEWLLGRPPALEAAFLEAVKADKDAIRISVEEIAAINVTDLIQTISIPCLLVHGQSDPVVQMPSQEMLGSLPELAHSIVFEQSGHFPMIDESNKFNRLLGDFLSLAPGESPRQLQLKEEWRRRVR